MRTVVCLLLLTCWLPLLAQPDSLASRAIEPDQETSFENYELLALALLGFLLLLGFRFWFKRRQEKKE